MRPDGYEQTDAASHQLPTTQQEAETASKAASTDTHLKTCMLLQDIEKGEELFIDYGGQYDRTSYGTSYNIRSRSVGTRRPF